MSWVTGFGLEMEGELVPHQLLISWRVFDKSYVHAVTISSVYAEEGCNGFMYNL